MESCTFIDFISVLKPWLNDDYVRKAGLDEKGNFRLQLTDGGVKNFKVSECNENRIKEVIAMLQGNGIPVEKL